MAERRMFAKTIVLSDAFLDMPLSSRCLYFTLGMFADDDGFVNNPKSIMRQVGASLDDMNLLIAKKFIISFDSGIIVIKHWRIHNYIQKDRYKETKYLEEKGQITTDEKGAYTQCIQDVSIMYTQDRIGKDSLVEDRLIEQPQKRFKKPTLEEIQAYCQERNNNVDAKAFFDYYETGNWKDAKGKPVRNWKQKVITWERSGNGGKNRSKPKPAIDYDQFTE